MRSRIRTPPDRARAATSLSESRHTAAIQYQDGALERLRPEAQSVRRLKQFDPDRVAR